MTRLCDAEHPQTPIHTRRSTFYRRLINERYVVHRVVGDGDGTRKKKDRPNGRVSVAKRHSGKYMSRKSFSFTFTSGHAPTADGYKIITETRGIL